MTAETLYLTWLNYLGGFEYFPFTSKKQYEVDTLNATTGTTNIMPNWPNSYNEFASTLDKQIVRDNKNSIVVTSQFLTLNQLNILTTIKDSVVVEILYSRHNRRRVIVDTNSFKVYNENDDTFTVTMRLTYTDLRPSQRL